REKVSITCAVIAIWARARTYFSDRCRNAPNDLSLAAFLTLPATLDWEPRAIAHGTARPKRSPDSLTARANSRISAVQSTHAARVGARQLSHPPQLSPSRTKTSSKYASNVARRQPPPVTY